MEEVFRRWFRRRGHQLGYDRDRRNTMVYYVGCLCGWRAEWLGLNNADGYRVGLQAGVQHVLIAGGSSEP